MSFCTIGEVDTVSLSQAGTVSSDQENELVSLARQHSKLVKLRQLPFNKGPVNQHLLEFETSICVECDEAFHGGWGVKNCAGLLWIQLIDTPQDHQDDQRIKLGIQARVKGSWEWLRPHRRKSLFRLQLLRPLPLEASHCHIVFHNRQAHTESMTPLFLSQSQKMVTPDLCSHSHCSTSSALKTQLTKVTRFYSSAKKLRKEDSASLIL